MIVFCVYGFLALNAHGFIEGDEVEYVHMAWNLKKGHGFWGSSVRSYFFPLLLLTVCFPFADSPDHFMIAARLLCAAFASLCVYTTILLGKEMRDETTGLIAGILTATSPLFLICAFRPFSDLVATAFCLIAIYFFHRCLTRNSYSRGLIGGFITALSVMCHYRSIVLAIITVLYGILMKKYRQTSLFFTTLLMNVILIQGLLDYFSWGEFLCSFLNFVELNFNLNCATHTCRYLILGLSLGAFMIFVLGVNQLCNLHVERRPVYLFASSIIPSLAIQSLAWGWNFRLITVSLPFLYLLCADGLVRSALAVMPTINPLRMKRHAKRTLIHLTALLLFTQVIATWGTMASHNIGIKANAQYIEAAKWVAQQPNAKSVAAAGPLVGWHLYIPYNVELYDIEWELALQDRRSMDDVLGKTEYLILSVEDAELFRDLIESYGFTAITQFDYVIVFKAVFKDNSLSHTRPHITKSRI